MKKGVTIVMLSVMIAVLAIILTAVAIMPANKAKNEAKEIAFKEEIKKIENAVKEEYHLTGKLPVNYDNINGVSLDEISIFASNAETFKKEVIKNNDKNEKFIKLDLEKVGVSKVKKDLANSYILTKGSMHVYCLQGLTVGENEIYTNISNEVVEENAMQEIKTNKVSDVVNIKKVQRTWASVLDVKIDAELVEDEKIKVDFLDENKNIIFQKEITEQAKNGTFKISTELASNDILLKTKSINFYKINTKNEKTSEKNIDIKNLDITVPKINSSKSKITKEENDLSADIYITDNQSGVDRFIYISEDEAKDMNKDEIVEYLLLHGRDATVIETTQKGEYLIQIREEAKGKKYVAICIDKAGNIEDKIKINTNSAK